jgi:hypothetical protein
VIKRYIYIFIYLFICLFIYLSVWNLITIVVYGYIPTYGGYHHAYFLIRFYWLIYPFITSTAPQSRTHTSQRQWRGISDDGHWFVRTWATLNFDGWSWISP